MVHVAVTFCRYLDIISYMHYGTITLIQYVSTTILCSSEVREGQPE